MKFIVQLEGQAEKELKNLSKQMLKRLDKHLQALADKPIPRGAMKLKGKVSEGWRIRVGDYRIVYTVDENHKTIMVYRIKHRREVYR